MEIPGKDSQLAQLMQQILQVQYTDMKRLHNLCLTLRRAAQQKQDTYALCFAENFLADYYLSSNVTLPTLLRQMNRAISASEASGIDALRMQIYNIYGVMLGGRGEHGQAADYYVRALICAERQGDYENISVLNLNLSDTFMQLHQYQKALPYSQRGMTAAHRMKSCRRKQQFIMTGTLNLSEIYVHLKRPEQAMKLLEHFIPAIEGKYIASFDVTARAMKCRALYALGRTQEALEEIDWLLAHPAVDYNAEEMFFYMAEKALWVALQLHDEPRSKALMEALQMSDYAQQSVQRRRQCLDFEIQYTEQFGDESRLLELYRRLHTLQIEEMHTARAERAAALCAKIEAVRGEDEKYTMQKQNEELRELSGKDELTQLANRRLLNNKLSQSFYCAQKEAQPLGTIMIDIDFFKHFNDVYGHSVGDRLLRITAESLRTEDERFFPARYGGDEFLVVCDSCSCKEMEAYLLEVRAAFLKAQTELPNQKDAATLSAGYYNAVPTEKDTVESFFQRADTALYHAKKERGITVRYQKKDG